MDNLAVDNQDVESGIDEVINVVPDIWNGLTYVVSKLWAGLQSLIEVLPDIAIGVIVAAIFLVWAWRKVRNG